MDLKFSIPQGSCSEANIFTCYCSLIKEWVPLSVTLTWFAADHSIKKSFPAKCCKSEENTINTIESTLTTIGNRMTSVLPKLNNDKTELIMFGFRQMLKHANTISLGFWKQSTKKTSQISRWAPRLQSHIWRTCKTKIKSSNVKLHKNQDNKTQPQHHRLHYPSANAMHFSPRLLICMLYTITKKLLQKYQKIQNTCVKLVLNKCKYNSAMECLSNYIGFK